MTKEMMKWIYLFKEFGFFPAMEAIVKSLYLRQQMLLFCVILFTYKLHNYYTHISDFYLTPLYQMKWTNVLCLIAGHCCNTYLGLIAICVSASYLCLCLFRLVNFYLFGRNSPVNDNKFQYRSIGIGMFALSLSVGITGPSTTLLDALKKTFFFRYILMILMPDLMYLIYKAVDPEILQLSAMQTSRPFKHFRVLSMYGSFLILSIYTCTMFDSQQFVQIFIPMIIVSLSMCLQAVSSILIYLLFVYDGVLSRPLGNLDEIIFYIRSTAKFCDVIGFLIFACHGIWSLKTGTFNWIKSTMYHRHRILVPDEAKDDVV
jgi:hypothetical protein